MTREEAQAKAEREVLEYARGGHLERSEKAMGRSGQPTLERGFALLVSGMSDVEGKLYAGQMNTSSLITLAALCIELLRECHLKHHNGGN